MLGESPSDTETIQKMQVTTLGEFKLECEHGQPVCLGSTKASLLVIMLLLQADSALSRLSLAKLLWSRHEEEQALASLRQVIAKIKKATGKWFDRYFEVDRKSICLRSEHIESDLTWFHSGHYDEQAISVLGRSLPFQYVEGVLERQLQNWIWFARLQLYDCAMTIQVEHGRGGVPYLAPKRSECYLNFYGKPDPAAEDTDCQSAKAARETVTSSRAANSLVPDGYLTDALQVATLEDERLVHYLVYLRDKIQHFWIAGVLHASCGEQPLINVRLRNCPSLLKTPFQNLVTRRDPCEIHSEQLFDHYCQHKGRLVIVGEPGSGKTIACLRIIRQIMAVSAENTSAPVLLNLSTWKKGVALEAWIIDELDKRYDVPVTVGRELLRVNGLMLFLDGFDESAYYTSGDLGETINRFIKDNPQTPVTVSSRCHEYEISGTQLNLFWGYEICRLNREEVLLYSQNTHKDIYGCLAAEADFATQLHSPLTLSLAIKTFEGTLESDRLYDTDRLSRLFLDNMLTAIDEDFQLRERNFLNQLAVFMNAQNLSIFHLQDLTFDAIASPGLRRLGAVLTMAIVAGTAAAVISVASFHANGDLVRSAVPWGLAVVGVVILDLSGEAYKLKLLSRIRFSFSAFKENLPSRLINSVFYPTMAIGGAITYFFGWYPGVVSGGLLAISYGFFLGMDFDSDTSSRRAFSSLNEPVRETGKNALKGGLLGAAIGGVADVILFRHWPLGTGIGILTTIMFFIFGGLGLLQHYVIRIFLALNNQLPLRLGRQFCMAYRSRLLN